MRTFLFILTLILANINYAQDSVGTVTGLVWDGGEEDYAPFVRVEIIGDTSTYVTQTDIDGRYTVKNIPIGTYKARCINYKHEPNYYEKCFQIRSNEIVYVEMELKQVELIVCYFSSPYCWYQTPQTPELRRITIKESVNRFNLPTLLSGMTSDVRLSKENELQFQGARTGDYLQIIDGVKTLNFSNVPSATMKYISIYKGFIPAKYGDTNGGVIVIETLSYFDLLYNRFPEE